MRPLERLLGARHVGELALGVVVENEQAQRRPVRSAREPEDGTSPFELPQATSGRFADAAPDPDGLARATEGTQASVLDAETVPYVDVTAAQALVELAEELERRGIRHVLARDVGQVRDLLGRAEVTVETYPSVRAAVAALEGR